MMTGVDMVQVPYKASYMTDLLGGQIPMAFAPIAQIIEDVRAGKLIAIGVTHRRALRLRLKFLLLQSSYRDMQRAAGMGDARPPARLTTLLRN